MVFVFDLDDTVCDTDGYSEKYILDFFKNNNMPYKQIAKHTRYAEKKFDWDDEIALKWYRTYGDDMMSKFPLKKGVKEVFDKIHNLGHKIIIATARANDWHCNPKEVTKLWLEKNGIKYDKLYVGRLDKELICNEENADFFIDDDICITTKVAEHNKNMKVFLASTNYNLSLNIPDNIIRVNSLEEMLNISLNK